MNSSVTSYINNRDRTFSSGVDITSSADGAYSVYLTDLDNDGDNDILSASGNDNRIVWYENMLIP